MRRIKIELNNSFSTLQFTIYPKKDIHMFIENRKNHLSIDNEDIRTYFVVQIPNEYKDEAQFVFKGHFYLDTFYAFKRIKGNYIEIFYPLNMIYTSGLLRRLEEVGFIRKMHSLEIPHDKNRAILYIDAKWYQIPFNAFNLMYQMIRNKLSRGY